MGIPAWGLRRSLKDFVFISTANNYVVVFLQVNAEYGGVLRVLVRGGVKV